MIGCHERLKGTKYFEEKKMEELFLDVFGLQEKNLEIS